MQNTNLCPDNASVELCCFSDCEEETEQLVIFELVVPVAAKVPPPRQRVAIATLVVRPASVTSTVPGRMLTQLRANNTALGGAWCMTATLARPPAARPAPY